jgi:multiple sugar transport system substrate-binding protein
MRSLKTAGMSLGAALLAVAGTTPMASAAGAAHPVTITFAMWGPVNPQYNFITAFEHKYPNIHVSLTEIPQQNYEQKIMAEVATGTAPDVMLVWENMIGPLAKEGAIVKLNPYIKHDPNLQVSNFLPAFRNLAAQNGGEYGFPWCWATHLLFYNENMFRAAHVPFPTANWTWQDYANAAKKLTVVKNGRVVQWGSAGLGFFGVWYSLIGSAGDPVVNSHDQLAIGPGAIRAMEWQYDLTNKLKVQPQPAPTTSSVDLFEAGKAAMILNGSWMVSTYDSIKSFKWNIAPLPYDTVKYDDLHTAFFTINSRSPYKQADWDFIQFCMSPEGQKLIEEGTNNPSAELSLQKYAWYKLAGPNGPTNWSAFNIAGERARLGYVLLPTGLTNYIANELTASVLGQVSPKEVVKLAYQEAKQIKTQ